MLLTLFHSQGLSRLPLNGELEARVVRTYQSLRALPRRMRQRLQQQWKQWLVGVALLLTLWASPALAASFGPISDGDVTGLIDAIEAANDETTNPGADTIILANNSTYTLSATADARIPFAIADGHTGLPFITSGITIEGNGSVIERDASLFTDPADRCSSTNDSDKFRILRVAENGNLTLEAMTIQHGCADDLFGGLVFEDEDGGGILVRGALTLTQSTVRENTATGGGGGISTSQFGGPAVALTMISSTVTDNTANGAGGIFNIARTLTLIESTVSTNTASVSSGGGIATVAGLVTLMNSTVSGNWAASNGGGLHKNSGGTVTLTNSTVSGNSAGNSGGGIDALEGGQVTLINSTVSENMAMGSGGGIANRGSGTPVTLTNTIVADQVAGADCFVAGSGTLTSNDFNLDSDGTCNLTEANDKPNNPNANLGPLQINPPGTTATHALLANSDAIDMGDCSGGTITEDQRGVARPQGDACDIGAFELEEETAVTTDDLLTFFDQAVADGTLRGVGSGRLAALRLKLMRLALVVADTLVEGNRIDLACVELQLAFRLTDGQSRPRDLVTGPAAPDLALLITDVREELGCE